MFRQCWAAFAGSRGLVESVAGSIANVIGLPMEWLEKALRRLRAGRYEGVDELLRALPPPSGAAIPVAPSAGSG
jgi:hypothetical protein